MGAASKTFLFGCVAAASVLAADSFGAEIPDLKRWANAARAATERVVSARPSTARDATASLVATSRAQLAKSAPAPEPAPLQPGFLLKADGDDEVPNDNWNTIPDDKKAVVVDAKADVIPIANDVKTASLQVLSTARETWIMAEPKWRSRKLGYLRAGAHITRANDTAGNHRCKGGWYAVEPKGFICAGPKATLTPKAHPIASLTAEPRFDGLPYTYVTTSKQPAALYARLPTVAQQKKVEHDLAKHLRIAKARQGAHHYIAPPVASPLPGELAAGAGLPGLSGKRVASKTVLFGRAHSETGLAIMRSFDHEGRRFGLTTDFQLVAMDRTKVVKQSSLKGIHLSDELTLPVAFVTSKAAHRFIRHQGSGALGLSGVFGWRSILSLSGKSEKRGGRKYLETVAGDWVDAARVAVAQRYKKAPKWARQGKKWVDVSILRQTLVAYQGRRPVYAALVSTGAGGIGDPKETHATVQGTFLIHTKHVSVTMDGDDNGDTFDLHDVPFVQYFNEGYALHAAYWHDDFGRPRSHGCINLAPIDAAWLFGWSDPQVPRGWHAALSLNHGTVVHIHP